MTPLYKIPGFLMLPSSLVLLLLLLALLGPRKLRTLCLLAAISLVTFGSVAPLSSPLLAVKEQQIAVPQIERAPDYIVVLGSGHVSDPKLPLVAQLYYSALARITQGVVLAKQYPDSQLVFTGYAGGDTVTAADKGGELAISLGIEPSRIQRYPTPRNTEEEAQATAALLKGKSTLLITSASHLPRALDLFESQGLEVTGYPTGHLVKKQRPRDWSDWWPRADNWLVFERWVYEELALLRQRLF